MNKKIVILNGRENIGKDYMINKYSEEISCMNVSIVDKFKEAGKVLFGTYFDAINKDTEEYYKYRKYLAGSLRLVTELFPLHPIKLIIDKADEFLKDDIHEVLFLHIRNPDNIRLFKELINHPVTTILLINNTREKDMLISNEEDLCVYEYKYDYIIMNNNDEESVDKFIETVNAL